MSSDATTNESSAGRGDGKTRHARTARRQRLVPSDFRQDCAARGRNVTPSNFNSLLNGSFPEWTNYNLIVKSDRLRNDREGRDYSGVVSRCSPQALANRAPCCGPGL